jgi:hypothetical protein
MPKGLQPPKARDTCGVQAPTPATPIGAGGVPMISSSLVAPTLNTPANAARHYCNLLVAGSNPTAHPCVARPGRAAEDVSPILCCQTPKPGRMPKGLQKLPDAVRGPPPPVVPTSGRTHNLFSLVSPTLIPCHRGSLHE